MEGRKEEERLECRSRRKDGDRIWNLEDRSIGLGIKGCNLEDTKRE